MCCVHIQRAHKAKLSGKQKKEENKERTTLSQSVMGLAKKLNISKETQKKQQTNKKETHQGVLHN